MTHDQFHIGLEFWCGTKHWRCTDVGSRIIVAISLDPHEVVAIKRVPDHAGEVRERRFMTDDSTWLNGPPFAVVEHVFDEYDLEACSLVSEPDAKKRTAG